MQVNSLHRVTVRLDDTDPDYFEQSSSGQRFKVHTISYVVGGLGTVTVTGLMVKKDGALGLVNRDKRMSINELPEPIRAAIKEYLS